MKRSTLIVYVLVMALMTVSLVIIIFFPEAVGFAVITEFAAVILAIILMFQINKAI